MEMKQIIRELENKLEETKAKIEEMDAKDKMWSAALEQVRKELSIERDNLSSLEMMIEAAKEGHFGLVSKKTVVNDIIKKETEEEPEEETEKEAEKESEKEHADNRHKNACILKLNRYNNVDDRWRTQRQAAKALNWDQSSVCKFMKLSIESQINRKGFALVWEY